MSVIAKTGIMPSLISKIRPGKVSSQSKKPEELHHRHEDTIDISGTHGDAHIHVREELDCIHETMEATHIAAEMSHAIGFGGAIAAAAGVGTVAAGVYFGIEGVKDMKHAIKHKEVMTGIESAGHLGLAAEAACETAIAVGSSSAAASMIGPAAAVLSSHALHLASASFGVVHGAAEIVIGGKEIYQGIKAKDKKEILSGALNVGIGATVTGIALGGGLPAGLALGTLFLGKMLFAKPEKLKANAAKIYSKIKSGSRILSSAVKF